MRVKVFPVLDVFLGDEQAVFLDCLFEIRQDGELHLVAFERGDEKEVLLHPVLLGNAQDLAGLFLKACFLFFGQCKSPHTTGSAFRACANSMAFLFVSKIFESIMRTLLQLLSAARTSSVMLSIFL